MKEMSYVSEVSTNLNLCTRDSEAKGNARRLKMLGREASEVMRGKL